ncbi:O-acyltransferase WSD1-like isoform X2 [Canna indica]|uniref:O-acyltransferase WSD1-like isoform X2 n=1 Tax=Canna indica TaxID=4628 RepID=A0AAQ3JVB5_9LILI|nr:O-acyltransferase WSD1-like isoform X2 [Canna indica]
MESKKRPVLCIKTRRTNTSSCADAGEVREGPETEEERGRVREEEEPVSPSGLLFRQRHLDCYIVAMVGIGKTIDVAAIKAGLAATLVNHPRFSSVQVGRREKLKWVRTEVAVDDHVIVPDLDLKSSTSSVTGDKVVEDYVSSLTTAPMDASRPLWELHILNVRTSEAAAVAVFRIHHSLGDGVSLISLLLACTRRTSDPASLPTLPEPRPPPPSPLRPNALLAVLLYAWAVLVLAWNTVVDLFFLVATSTWLRDTPTPLKGGEGVEFKPKRIVHSTVSLDDIKAIKNSMNCTINDVLVGVTSAGLSRYLNRRYGEDDAEKRKKKQLPANIRLRSAMLVNVRPMLGIQALADMMEGKTCGLKWGNFLSYMILSFPIVMYKDMLDYIRKGKAIVDKRKNSLQPVIMYRCAHFFVRKFGIKGGAAIIYKLVSNTTFSFSNIVGPVDEIGFYGHPIVYLAPSVYGHPHALTLHYQSYMNTMKIVMGVDESVIPDPHQLLDYLAESLKLIKEAISTR